VHPDLVLQLVLLTLGALSIVVILVMVGGLELLALALMAAGTFFVTHVSIRIGPVLLADLMFIGASVPIVLLALVRPSVRSRAPYWPMLTVLTVLVLGGLLGTFTARYPDASLSALARFALASIVMLLLFTLWQPTSTQTRWLMVAYVAGAVVSAALGFVIRGPAASGNRWIGLALHPNQLGATSYLSAGIVLGLLFTTRSRLQRMVLAAIAVGLFFAVIGTSSRGGLLAFATVVFCFCIALRQWHVLIGAAVVSTVGLMTLGNPFVRTDIAQANQERLERLRSTWAALGDSPFTGAGFENARFSHSLYLDAWQSAGLLGIVFIVGFVAIIGRTFLIAYQRKLPLTAGLASAYVGQLVASAFSPALWDRYLWMVVALLIAQLHHETVGVDQGVVSGSSGIRVEQLARS